MIFFFFVQDKWKDLFPTMISKAATLEMISNREDDGRDGVLQLVTRLVSLCF